MRNLLKSHWDDAATYFFTVICVVFGDYILHGTRPDLGWFEILGSLISAVLICLAVEVMQGRADTEVKKNAKKKNLPKRLLLSGLAGLTSQAIIPVMINKLVSSIGIEL